MRLRTGNFLIDRIAKAGQASKAAEKVVYFVIPSEAMNLRGLGATKERGICSLRSE
jgi:hypothetical protein